jgi:hypothetical protein
MPWATGARGHFVRTVRTARWRLGSLGLYLEPVTYGDMAPAGYGAR